MTTTTPSRQRRAAATALVAASLALTLAGCGDNEDTPSDETPAPAATEAAPAPEATEPADGEAAPEPTDDARFGTTLEQAGEAVVEALADAESFEVDGTTLTVTIGGDTSVGFDGSIDCLSVGGLVNEGETIVLAYPDGSTEC